MREKIGDNIKKIYKYYIIINNDGYGVSDNIKNILMHELQSFFNVNILSHILLLKCIIPYFKRKKENTIIFTSSEPALKGEKSVYSRAKEAFFNLYAKNVHQVVLKLP